MQELIPGIQKEENKKEDLDAQREEESKKRKEEIFTYLDKKMSNILEIINECAYGLEELKSEKIKKNLIKIFDNINILKERTASKKETLNVIGSNYVGHKLGNINMGLAWLKRIVDGKTEEDDEMLKDSKEQWEKFANLTNNWVNDEELFKKDLLRDKYKGSD